MGAVYIVFLLQMWGVFGFVIFCSLFLMQVRIYHNIMMIYSNIT